MKVKVTIEVSDQQLADIMTCAVESGDPVTRSWVQSMAYKSEYVRSTIYGWYADPAFYRTEFLFEIVEGTYIGYGSRHAWEHAE